MAETAPIGPTDDGKICDMPAGREATIEDLYRSPAKKAEIVGGRLVIMPQAGGLHGFAGGQILISLGEYARRTKRGYVMPDGVSFVVNLPNRRSFSPDVAFVNRVPLTENFIDGAPILAVEVRSKGDHGPAAERRMAEKRADYFAAGTLVVWDVDVLREQLVRVYRASDPLTPTTYRQGELAEAEPALPGWSMPVDDMFPME